jgi:hypothetical protein
MIRLTLGIRGQLTHPAMTHGLHVFARTPTSGYAEVSVPDDRSTSVAALQRVIIGELRLRTPPHSLRLLLEEEGKELRALDSRGTLTAQGVREGSSVVAVETPLELASFSNVLACGPDAAHRASLLGALTAPDTPAPARLRALNQLLVEHQARHPSAQVPLPLFETQAHLSLLQTLVFHALGLAQGDFEGVNGTACRTLVGAWGIGKTALLRAFALVCASAFPTVIALYISGEGMLDPTKSFSSASLHTLIESAAALRGASTLGEGYSGGIGIDAALSAKGLRMLIMVDEVDELYTVGTSLPNQLTHVLETLGRLSTLGGGFSGRYGVLLCGSSSSTYTLVCGGGVPGLEKRFPLVSLGIPDLNDQKFTRALVPSSTCAAMPEVALMLAALAAAAAAAKKRGGAGGEDGGDGEDREAALKSAAHLMLPRARLFTFFVGSSPRAVMRVANTTTTTHKSPQEALVDATPALTSSKLTPQSRALYLALLARLLKLNQGLRSRVRSKADGRVNVTALLMDPWEDLVVPLQWEDVEAVWGLSAGAATSDAWLLRHLVQELTDNHLLMLRGSFPARETLWPVTAVQVVASEEERVAWVRDAYPHIKDLLSTLTGLFTLGAQVGGAVLGKP